MPVTTALRDIARQLDDTASLSRALDALLTARTEPPALLGLGEPTHGIVAFPLLRNEILALLAERGYRSILLETDFFAAALVDDYVNGAPGDIDEVLETGFSHRFGAVPGNRELVEWLRAHNAERAPADRIRFYGFEAPVEYAAAPSPRRALTAVLDLLPAALRPASIGDMAALLGADGDWSNPDAMYDATASIGGSERARALRVIADDLASALRRAAPALSAADPQGYDLAVAHARTALGLLRYHAAMAAPGPDRMAHLLSVRAEMMTENILAVLTREQRRGPSLAFAHNVHLLRGNSRMPMGEADVNWCGAGALVGHALGARYLSVATDAAPVAEPNTLQSYLAAATNRRALFTAADLRAALPHSLDTSKPFLQGHIPLQPEELSGCDAVVFLADTDGKRHQYW
ncbi:erythromycin esterase family protein [Nocardia yamanashiensis]|uniref:erythromycin esterase family protein n=1 Tax=Nocardia yamanashiensis TaxID=209247 RepID=UPI00082A8C1F|nr:erythromycin esterase family protein [Nocardia yamanashiensis]